MTAMPMLLRSWWILALRGVLAVLFGLFALAMPGVTLLTVIALFAVYALLAGAVSVVGAIRNRRHAVDWWLLLLLGAISLAAGVLASLHPVLTLLALVLVIGTRDAGAGGQHGGGGRGRLARHRQAARPAAPAAALMRRGASRGRDCAR